jgi:Ca2+-binding RTX toxin-like protein
MEGGSGVDWLYGSFGNDILHGASFAQDSTDTDALFGQEGNDTLYGGAGGDSLDGGTENDTLWGGDGDDWLFGQAGDDALNGEDGSDVLFGGDGADVLSGGLVGDSLDGGAGNDILIGGAGVDILFGGTGADEFRFGGPGEGEDLIRDFVSGEDRVTLEASGFGLIGTGTAADLALWQTGEGLAADFGTALPVLYYETFFRTLWFDPDGEDNANATALASLETGALQATDVFLV